MEDYSFRNLKKRTHERVTFQRVKPPFRFTRVTLTVFPEISSSIVGKISSRVKKYQIFGFGFSLLSKTQRDERDEKSKECSRGSMTFIFDVSHEGEREKLYPVINNITKFSVSPGYIGNEGLQHEG